MDHLRDPAPFDPDDLVRFGSIEIVVWHCIYDAGHWFVEGQELNTQHWLSTAAENCQFIDTAQINLFGFWE